MGSALESNNQITFKEMQYKQIYSFRYSDYTERQHQELYEFVIDQRKKAASINKEINKEMKI